MKYDYSAPPILITDSESEDVYVFIDGYQEGSTDPALKLIVDDYIKNNTEISSPDSVTSKCYKLGSARVPENELTNEGRKEFIDWHENIVDVVYKDDNHSITHREVSIEVGASSLTEEVIIAVITGPATAILTVILAKLVNLYGSEDYRDIDDDEAHALIIELLKDKYGAGKNLKYEHSKKELDTREFTLIDENGSKYFVSFSQIQGIRSVRVKHLRPDQQLPNADS